MGLLSVAFLNRTLGKREWTGIIFVIFGLAVVGVADFSSNDSNENYNKNDIITGDMLIVIAQIIQAIQMVVEEKFVQGENIPSLQAVGWEGLSCRQYQKVILKLTANFRLVWIYNIRTVANTFLFYSRGATIN